MKCQILFSGEKRNILSIYLLNMSKEWYWLTSLQLPPLCNSQFCLPRDGCVERLRYNYYSALHVVRQ